MNLGDLGALPLSVGALVVMISALVGVVKGYRWLLDEIKTAVREALASHEDKETIWQREVTRRLDAIEEKVDRLSEDR